MDRRRADIELQPLQQGHIDWFRSQGIGIEALIHPTPLLLAYGVRHEDGRLDPPEPNERGQEWFAFEEMVPSDFVFWQPETNRFATYKGQAIALGETALHEAATYSFGCALTIYSDPLALLRAGKAGRLFGAVVFDWPKAWLRLFDKPRVTLATPELVPVWRRWMVAPKPEVSVIVPEAA